MNTLSFLLLARSKVLNHEFGARSLRLAGFATGKHRPLLAPVATLSQQQRIELLDRHALPRPCLAYVQTLGHTWLTVAALYPDERLLHLPDDLALRSCPKALGEQAWRLDELARNGDTLRLRATIVIDKRRLQFLEVGLGELPDAPLLAEGDVVVLSTAAIAAAEPAASQDMTEGASRAQCHLELDDLSLDRRLEHRVRAVVLAPTAFDIGCGPADSVAEGKPPANAGS